MDCPRPTHESAGHQAKAALRLYCGGAELMRWVERTPGARHAILRRRSGNSLLPSLSLIKASHCGVAILIRWVSSDGGGVLWLLNQARLSTD